LLPICFTVIALLGSLGGLCKYSKTDVARLQLTSVYAYIYTNICIGDVGACILDV